MSRHANSHRAFQLRGDHRDDQRRGDIEFSQGHSVGQTGNDEYAIEMFLQELALSPDNVLVHEALRELSLRRKAAGGKDIGTFEKLKLRAQLARERDPRGAMLAAEKLLAYDPGNVDRMIAVARCAARANLTASAAWIERIIRAAGGSDPMGE